MIYIINDLYLYSAVLMQLCNYLYVDYPPRNNTVGFNKKDSSYICHVTNNTDEINSSTVPITITADNIISNSTTIYPISSRIPSNTSDVTNTPQYLNSSSTTPYPLIVSSLAGGILVVFLIVCIVVSLLKRKLYRWHKRNDDFVHSPTDSLFNR